MMDEVLADVERRMNSTLDALRKDLASIRAAGERIQASSPRMSSEFVGIVVSISGIKEPPNFSPFLGPQVASNSHERASGFQNSRKIESPMPNSSVSLTEPRPPNPGIGGPPGNFGGPRPKFLAGSL